MNREEYERYCIVRRACEEKEINEMLASGQINESEYIPQPDPSICKCGMPQMGSYNTCENCGGIIIEEDKKHGF